MEKRKHVIQFKDPDAGVIVVRGGLSAKAKQVGVTMQGYTCSQVTIQVKDSEAKINFENTVWNYNGGNPWTYEDNKSFGKKKLEKWKEAVDTEQAEMITSFAEALKKKDDF